MQIRPGGEAYQLILALLAPRTLPCNRKSWLGDSPCGGDISLLRQRYNKQPANHLTIFTVGSRSGTAVSAAFCATERGAVVRLYIK